MQLPYFQSDNVVLNSLQTRWRSILNVFLANPLNDINMIENVVLQSGVNVINHKLGQLPQGWFLTDIQAAAQIYRSAPFNNLTLTLTSDAVVTVNIGVF